MNSTFRHLLGLKSTPVSQLLPEEIHLPALGERWTLKYLQTASGWVQARSNGGGVLVASGKVGDYQEVLRGLRRWLVRRARFSFLPWLDELSQCAGFSFGSTAIRGQRTRWASCSSRGTISLNFRLLFLDPDVVRYVFNHELCHTVHLNHSKDFWRLLASLEPGYRELNLRVKRGMEEVPEWAKGH